jgi:hypothetical protein
MHFHTQHNRRGHQINLSELYFDAKEINQMPLEVEKVQDIDNITTKLGK